MNFRNVPLIKVALLALAGFAGTQLHVVDPAVAEQAAAPTPPPVELAEGPGKDRLIASCASCHEAAIVIGMRRDLAGWQELIDQMIARGAQVSDEDRDAIAAYLAKNYT